MSETMRLTDDAIRAALTLPQTVRAPSGLAEAISATVDETPQRGAGIFGWLSTPLGRKAQQLALVGLLLLTMLLLALLIASRPSRPQVSTYHGDAQRTGVMPGPGPADAPPPIAWEQTARGPFGTWSPAVVDGRVYVGDRRGFVTAYDEANGEQLWQVDEGASINSGITVANGLVLVGTDAGLLVADDAATGAQVWTYATAAPIHGSAAVVDGYIYFGTTDGHLYALSLDGTDLRWPVIQASGSISRSIAAANGVIYAGSGGATANGTGNLEAVDGASGRVLWSADLEPGNTSSPAVADGKVYVGGGLDGGAAGHHVYAFDARTGQPAWAAPFGAPTNEVLLLGAVSGGRVYVTGEGGSLYVLDASTGALQWSMPIQSSQSPNAGLVGQVLYVTSDDRQVHAIDVTRREELWAVQVTGTPSAPAVIDGAIFVNTSSGEVIRIGSVPAQP